MEFPDEPYHVKYNNFCSSESHLLDLLQRFHYNLTNGLALPEAISPDCMLQDFVTIEEKFHLYYFHASQLKNASRDVRDVVTIQNNLGKLIRICDDLESASEDILWLVCHSDQATLPGPPER